MKWPRSLEWWDKNDFWIRVQTYPDLQREASLCIAIALAENRIDLVRLVEENWFMMKELPRSLRLQMPYFLPLHA